MVQLRIMAVRSHRSPTVVSLRALRLYLLGKDRPRARAVALQGEREHRASQRGRIETSLPHTTSRYRDVYSGVQVVRVM